MKNPMSTTKMKQAIEDIEAGHDMQIRILGDADWMDRIPPFVGKPPNFLSHEYRRKPEPHECFVVVYKDGSSSKGFHSYQAAKEWGCDDPNSVCVSRLVKDPDWVEPEPEETNPWRPIVKDKWPECKPGSKIIMRWRDGTTISREAGLITWHNTAAIEWKFAEDE